MASPFKKPQIPARNSSKRNFDAFTDADQKEKQELEVKIKQMTKKSKLGPLKPKLSYDADYFGHVSEFSELQSKKARLSRKQSLTDFMQNSEDATEEAWEQTLEAQKLTEKAESYELDAKVYKAQAERRSIDKGDVDKLQRRHFMQEWTMSPRGFNAEGFGAGTRDPRDQSKFRQDLIEACGAKHPDPKRLELWCPVLGDFIHEKLVNAAHIFPYSLGQVAMHNIFGLYERDELFAIENGLLLCGDVEERISLGYMAIVPAIPDRPSQRQVDEWRESEPKAYKIRVLNPTPQMMNTCYPWTANEKDRKTWCEMDGRLLRFGSDHRPRARYLYWQYCTSVLRSSWRERKDKQRDMLKQEFNRAYWGTKGIFMNKVMLQGFAEEMGHRYEDLVEDYADEVAKEPDPEAVLTANMAIRLNRLRGGYGFDEGDEDDEDDEEEDDDDEDDDY